MHVKILNNCIGCSACVQINPEIFEIFNNYAVVNDFYIENNEELCIDASLECPVGAIIVEMN